MIRQALPTICKKERQGATADGPAARLREYILVDYVRNKRRSIA